MIRKLRRNWEASLFYHPHLQISFHNISKYSICINVAFLQLIIFCVLGLHKQQKLTHISVSQVQIPRRRIWLAYFEVHVHPHLISYGLGKDPEEKLAQLRLNLSTHPITLGLQGDMVPVTQYVYTIWDPFLLGSIRKWGCGIGKSLKNEYYR